MIVYLKNAMLEIINDMPACIGWKHGRPTKQEWLETREEAEVFLGYRIADWDAFLNPSTNTFWVKIGNVCYCKNGEPALIDQLNNTASSMHMPACLQNDEQHTAAEL